EVPIPWVLRNGVCSPILNGPAVAWHTIDVLDPAQFVAANETVHASPEGLGVRVLEAEDGSRENNRLVDARTNRPCEVLSDHVVGAPARCVPMPFGVSSAQPFFDGPGCDRPIGFANSCDRAETAVVLRTAGCGTSVDLVELGMPVQTDAGGLFRKYTNSDCQSVFLFDPIPAFTLGRSVEPSTFPGVDDEVLGMDRLQIRLHRLSDGMRVRNARLLPIRGLLDPDSFTSAVQPATYEFFDTVRKTKCFVTKTGDETLRCLPIDTIPRLGRYFGDPACTRP